MSNKKSYIPEPKSSIQINPAKTLATSELKLFNKKRLEDYLDMEEFEFRDKYNISKHRFRYENDPDYQRQSDLNASKSNSFITYPKNDIKRNAPINSL
jgi:hypothetical protein